MAQQTLSILMADSYKTKIIDVISNVIKADINQFKADHNLATFISVHFLKWDFINTHLFEILTNEDYHCAILDRGSLWSLVLIYEKKSKYLYVLMRETRYDELVGRHFKDKPHYLDALAFINNDLVSDPHYKSQQLELFETVGEDWDQCIDAILSKVKGLVPGSVERFVLITFDTERDEVKSVNANLLAADLHIAYKENWNEFISADFGAPLHLDENIGNDVNDDEIMLPLREGVVSHESDSIVQLRKDTKAEED